MASIAKNALSSSGSVSRTIKTVTIIGGGLMGSGIAQVAAETEHNVIVVDQKQEFLDKSLNIIQTSLKRIVKKKFDKDQQKGEQYYSDTLNRIRTTTDVDDAV
ncbi:unnamed protein product [Didymodactylos carnosus]|uniref:3-hydroxyacyl-CoA dehydrogenase NAD binding domain-containing protein n=1 Tax=Didymodactylos carnosus TaxID=1234261 RepID=A0A816G3K2_9BILA|nr:unnamed protein product [Didymodactylos carnosus]CAF4640003.1 unnamed protein product [Didymodactylos carnosus]